MRGVVAVATPARAKRKAEDRMMSDRTEKERTELVSVEG